MFDLIHFLFGDANCRLFICFSSSNNGMWNEDPLSKSIFSKGSRTSHFECTSEGHKYQ